MINKRISRLAIVIAAAMGVSAVVAYQYAPRDLTSLNIAAQAAKEKADLANPRKIGWNDLLPEGKIAFVPPDASSDFASQQASPFPSSEMGSSEDPGLQFTPLPTAEARTELADQAVKLAGYMTPLNVEQGKTRMFLLVPYVGACIHVPAPPANQIVLVETPEPIEVREMWEPFEAIGTLRIQSISTELAEVSYTMDLDRIEPYVDDLEDQKTEQN